MEFKDSNSFLILKHSIIIIIIIIIEWVTLEAQHIIKIDVLLHKEQRRRGGNKQAEIVRCPLRCIIPIDSPSNRLQTMYVNKWVCMKNLVQMLKVQ